MDIAGMKKWGNHLNLNPKNNLKPTTGNALSKACCERTKVIKSLKANHNGITFMPATIIVVKELR